MTLTTPTTTERTIRVLLVDDTETVRRALRLTLSVEPDLCVVGEAADGEYAVRLAQELHPDIILMDLELPGMDGLDATRRIKAAGERGVVIMLTAFGGEEIRGAAARAGVALFLEKGDNLDDLAETIRALHERNNPA
jgi:two-component system, NarL family, response regulator DesR